MRSCASAQILDGDGSVAPGFMHRICQTARMSAERDERREYPCGDVAKHAAISLV